MFPASNFNDGKLSTVWAADGPAPVKASVVLSRVRTISRIVFHGPHKAVEGAGAVTTLTVNLFDTSTNAGSLTLLPQDGDAVWDLATPTAVTKVNIDCTKVVGGAKPAIGEIEVCGR